MFINWKNTIFKRRKMNEQSPSYREVFPLWCEIDILDAHDYREEVFEYSLLKDVKPFNI